MAESPPGSVFWLEPGEHRLGRGPFDQVIPDDGDVFVGAPGAVLDGKKISRYAFTGSAVGVTIAHLTIKDFGAPGTNNNEGVVNHDSARGWMIVSNTIRDNAGAGVMIGSENRVLANCLRSNGQYAFNAYHPDGVRDVELSGNEITGNNTDDWEARVEGCGCTGGGKFWETVNASIVGNYVHDNRGPGLWADTNNAGFLFERNYVSGNDGEGIFYETSYNAAILENTFVGNAVVSGRRNTGFPVPAVYLSESGGDSRAPGPYEGTLVVARNHFVDNWSGVVAWENADRFVGSPANTSTGALTLVAEKPALAGCTDPDIVARPPLLDDCRWKTQNVLVEDNAFILASDRVPGCGDVGRCGINGLFANYGTFPDWSPYKGELVAKAITFDQGNAWRSNTYSGPWKFMVELMGDPVDWDTWTAPPYGQDVGSTQESNDAGSDSQGQ